MFKNINFFFIKLMEQDLPSQIMNSWSNCMKQFSWSSEMFMH